MIPDEFIKEVNGSSLKPKSFDEMYSRFREYQLLSIKTLNEFHAVCEANNISYQLAFGSLLGCIRDGGIIPWDYDVDVFVPFSQRRRLIDSLNRDLNQDFYFFSIENNSKCNHVIVRLAPKGYDTAVIHVDVFFLTGLPNDHIAAKKHKKIIKRRTLMIKAFRYNYLKHKTDDTYEMFKMICYRLIGLFNNKDQLWQKYIKTVEEYPMESFATCCLADRFSGLYKFESDMFRDTILIDNSYGTYRIPVKYEEVLKCIYGDYMKIPSLASRLEELEKHYYQLEKYSKLDD